ncbi:MAG: deoxyribonuclease IV [Deltaproteobacteria bacterium]|nr:deoxyribonuclease IV [Deltaproteobacteria bacterium]
MRLGFHLSIAGSLGRALREAQRLGCQALQIFVQNPRAWRWREVTEAQAAAFREERRRLGLTPLVVHLTYLPNLAGADAALYRRSRDRLAAELLLSQQLGGDYLVCHPGHAEDTEPGLVRAARALAYAVARVAPPPLVLLENTAGQGRELGRRPAELGRIMELCGAPLGLCLDTAHAFGAGYDLNHPAGRDRLLGEIAGSVGLERLKVIHLNNSRAVVGSCVDRHAHLRLGAIGLPGLAALLAHPFVRPEAVIMETPKRHPLDDWLNLLTARSLVATPSLPIS